MRELCLILARARTYTPVSYWMDMPLIELMDWPDTIEAVGKKEPKPKK